MYKTCIIAARTSCSTIYMLFGQGAARLRSRKTRAPTFPKTPPRLDRRHTRAHLHNTTGHLPHTRTYTQNTAQYGKSSYDSTSRKNAALISILQHAHGMQHPPRPAHLAPLRLNQRVAGTRRKQSVPPRGTGAIWKTRRCRGSRAAKVRGCASAARSRAR